MHSLHSKPPLPNVVPSVVLHPFCVCTFRFRSYYGLDIGKKMHGESEEKAPSKHTLYAQEQRRNRGTPKIDPLLEEQFNAGRLLACISSRPGQVGRADGYILEVSVTAPFSVFARRFLVGLYMFLCLDKYAGTCGCH